VVPLSDLAAVIRATLAEWIGLRWSDLRFMETPTTVLTLVVLFALSLLVLLWGMVRRNQPERTHLALPAILPVMRRSRLSAMRHAPFVVFLLGVPFFAMALADPRIVLTRESINRSGRRIAILIDASGSMILPFEAPKLEPQMDRAFYVGVAAAGEFLKLRKDGGHSDVVALIEFGNEAYVVTPFTTDYENVQVSATLISNPRAWNRFNVFGTTIIQGIEQGLQLFRTFGMMKASGNLIVIFSDGNDGETNFRGRTLADYMAEARANDIPMYMVRLGYQKPLGDVQYDALWKPAMESTGGGFYPAYDETSVLRAVSEIDRLSAGRIDTRHFSSERPGFAGYALVAISLWVLAAALKLGVRSFRTFP
jgi:hypothetical protein